MKIHRTDIISTDLWFEQLPDSSEISSQQAGENIMITKQKHQKN